MRLMEYLSEIRGNDPSVLIAQNRPAVCERRARRSRSRATRWARFRPLILLAFCAVVGAQDDAVVHKSGKVFRVCCHGGTPAMAEEALVAVESVWSVVVELLGMEGRKNKGLLDVHLYRSIAGYEEADRRLTGGRFQRNLAMCDPITMSAHVAVQPPCSDEALAAMGLPGQTVEMLAWESCHAVRFSLCPNFASQPMWFVDGLAEYVSSICCDPEKGSDPAGLPRSGARMMRAIRLTEAGEMPAASAILADDIDALSFGDRYSIRAVFFRFLLTEAMRPRTRQAVAAVISTGGGEGYKEKVLAKAKMALGEQLDRRFVRYVARLDPHWDEVFRALDTRHETWQQVAYPGTNAIAWRRQPVRGKGIRIRGGLRILPANERQQFNLLLRAPDLGGFYSVAFVAGDGISVMRYRAEVNEWTRIGGIAVPQLQLAEWHEFVVEASGERLRVECGEKIDLELPVELGRELQWGLGAQAGSAGEWRGIRAAPLR